MPNEIFLYYNFLPVRISNCQKVEFHLTENYSIKVLVIMSHKINWVIANSGTKEPCLFQITTRLGQSFTLNIDSV